jgi:RNA polymerase sigma factor (sigma-70 family)
MSGNPSAGGQHFSLDGCLARLRTLAHRMLSRRPDLRGFVDTSDLVQGSALRLQVALASAELGSPRSIVALAVTQLNRELVDKIRRNRVRLRWLRTAGESVSAEYPNDDTLEDWTRFHEAVENLPQEQRDAVHCLWYLGLDQATAAASLGVSARTLRRYWRDGRDALRKSLPDLYS